MSAVILLSLAVALASAQACYFGCRSPFCGDSVPTVPLPVPDPGPYPAELITQEHAINWCARTWKTYECDGS